MADLSWKAVADALADRMFHHARCAQHPVAETAPEYCPFCADRAAYLLWQAKSGQRHRTPIAGGGEVLNVLRAAREAHDAPEDTP